MTYTAPDDTPDCLPVWLHAARIAARATGPQFEVRRRNDINEAIAHATALAARQDPWVGPPRSATRGPVVDRGPVRCRAKLVHPCRSADNRSALRCAAASNCVTAHADAVMPPSRLGWREQLSPYSDASVRSGRCLLQPPDGRGRDSCGGWSVAETRASPVPTPIATVTLYHASRHDLIRPSDTARTPR